MEIDFQCPSCEAPVSTNEDNAGKLARCGKCGEIMRVPESLRLVAPAPNTTAATATRTIDNCLEPVQLLRDSIPYHICRNCGYITWPIKLGVSRTTVCHYCQNSNLTPCHSPIGEDMILQRIASDPKRVRNEICDSAETRRRPRIYVAPCLAFMTTVMIVLLWYFG